MKTFYIVAAIAGYAAVNSLMLLESVQEGNILLWTKPLESAAGMFANRISTIFVIDLFLVVAVAFVWMYDEGQRLGVKRVWLYWLLTMLFGLAGTLPLFLNARRRALEAGRQ